MLTEQQNPNTRHIDALSTAEIAARMNAEDQTVPLAVQRALPQIVQAIDLIVEQLRAGGRLFYVGAGTSGRLAIIDAVECVPTFSVPPELVQGIHAGGEAAFTHSIEDVEDRAEAGRQDLQARGLTPLDVVVGVAASGHTPYVLGALEYAREIDARTVGIACNQPAPLMDAGEIGIALLVGPEVVTGSTRLKAGTAQKLVLNMISTTVMIKLGKVYDNLMVDVQIGNDKLLRRARRIVEQVGKVDAERAAELIDAANQEVKVAIVMGRLGVTAEEARTKLAAAGGHLRPLIGDSDS